MQPSSRLKPEEIKNITDWLFNELPATTLVEVKNISEQDYKFRYCTDENISTPDADTRIVLDRQYDERTFAPGETTMMLGAPARLFVEDVARTYMYETTYAATKGKPEDRDKAAAQALLDLPRMIEAAKKVIVGEPEVVSSAQAKPRTAPKPAATKPAASKPAEPKQPQLVDQDEYRAEPQEDGSIRYYKGDVVVSKAEYDQYANQQSA